MQDEQTMSEEQRIKFSALFLKEFGLKIDADNELLPLFYITYHASRVANTNNKKVYENVDKMVRALDERLEKRSQSADRQVGKSLEVIEGMVVLIGKNLAKHKCEMDEVISSFDQEIKHKLASFQAKQYHFTGAGQAFWYAFGKYGLPAIIAMLLVFIAFIRVF